MAERAVKRSYLATFTAPIAGRFENQIRSRFDQTTIVSPFAAIVRSKEDTRTVFGIIRQIIGDEEPIFVARLDSDIEAESFGMSPAAQRSYCHKPSGQVLRSLKDDVAD